MKKKCLDSIINRRLLALCFVSLNKKQNSVLQWPMRFWYQYLGLVFTCRYLKSKQEFKTAENSLGQSNLAQWETQFTFCLVLLLDLAIRGNLMPAGACGEEQTEECSRLEESVAERYKDRKSDDNKRMRGELQKVSSRTETSMLSK